MHKMFSKLLGFNISGFNSPGRGDYYTYGETRGGGYLYGDINGSGSGSGKEHISSDFYNYGLSDFCGNIYGGGRGNGNFYGSKIMSGDGSASNILHIEESNA